MKLKLALGGRSLACCAFIAAAAGCSGHRDDEKILNVYSWMDYIAPETVANFERDTGIKVHYATYDNNEVLETHLLTGHTGYDIVIPTGVFFERQLKAGVYRKLDKTLIPNLRNADPDIMRRLSVHDPGNLYATPYMWTTVGLGVNVKQVRSRLGATEPDGWSLLFDPVNAAKLKDCGITIVDSPLDVFEAALISLGRDPNRMDPEDVTAASEALQKIRPFVRYIDPAQYIPDLANGNVCLSLAWSGDIEQARSRAAEAGTGAEIAYLLPREGSILSVDMIGIPADAPHPRNAEIWMNYLLRPEVSASITNYIHYPNGNAAAFALLPRSITSDAAIYPDAAQRARLVSQRAVSTDYSRLITREWTRFRTGY